MSDMRDFAIFLACMFIVIAGPVSCDRLANIAISLQRIEARQ